MGIKSIKRFFKEWFLLPANLQRSANNGETPQWKASLGARGIGLTKVASAPVLIVCCTVPLILGGPFGIAAGAIGGSLLAVPVVGWGVGDLVCPELIYCKLK